MFFEIPLDQVFSGVFTDARSGERTPTGAVRRGLRPDPRRSRGAAEPEYGQCSRPSRTGRSDSSECGGNDESAGVTGDRGGRRVRPGRRSPPGGVGDGGLLERSYGHGATRSRASGSAKQPGTFVAFGRRAGVSPPGEVRSSTSGCTSVHGEMGPARERWSRSRRNWGHPNWTQRARFRLAPGPMARATGSA